MSSRFLNRQRFLYATLLAFGAVLVFILPWQIPIARRVVSDSYTLGFNNMIAVLSIGVILLALTALRWKTWTFQLQPAQTQPASERVPFALFSNHDIGHLFPRDVRLTAIIAGAAALFVWIAWMKLPLHYYSEIRSFIPATELILLNRSPYTQFHWNYGPLLLYLPIWLVQLSGGSIGVDGAYIASLLIATIAGLALLATMTTVLEAKQRTAFFVMAALPFVFNISLGMNYTALRFTAPYAALLWLHRNATGETITRQRTLRLALIVTAGAIFCFAISPESGLGFFAAALIYLGALARRQPLEARALLFISAALGIVASVIFFACVSWDYLASVLGFGSGGGNFPLFPSVYVLFFLGALVFAIPILAVYGLKNRGTDAAFALSWAFLATLFVAPALGRGDPGHIFCNGLGVFLGGFVLLHALAPSRVIVAQTAFALLFCLGLPLIALDHSTGALSAVWHAHAKGEHKIDRRFWLPVSPARQKQETVFENGLKSYAQIGTPLGCDEDMEIFLKRTGRYVPEYFAPSAHNPLTEKQVARKLAGIQKMPVILIPAAAIQHSGFQENQSIHEKLRGEFLSRLLLYPVRYRWRNKPLFAEAESKIFVRRNFSLVRSMGPYLIMKRNAEIVQTLQP